MSLPMAWLTLQVVTAALWNDGHQTDDEDSREWVGSEQECVPGQRAGYVQGTSWLVMRILIVRAGYKGIWWKSKHALCVLTPRESHKGNPTMLKRQFMEQCSESASVLVATLLSV